MTSFLKDKKTEQSTFSGLKKAANFIQKGSLGQNVLSHFNDLLTVKNDCPSSNLLKNEKRKATFKRHIKQGLANLAVRIDCS